MLLLWIWHLVALLQCLSRVSSCYICPQQRRDLSNLHLFLPFPGKLANHRLPGAALQNNLFPQRGRDCCAQVLACQQWFCDANSRNFIFCDNLPYGLFLLTLAPVLGTKKKDAEEWVPCFWFLEHGQLYKGTWLLFSQRDGVYVEGSRGDLLGWKAMAIVAGCVCVPHWSFLHASIHCCCCWDDRWITPLLCLLKKKAVWMHNVASH